MKVEPRTRWVEVPLIESPADGLAAVRDELVGLEVRRAALLARRDALVGVLRAEGSLSWNDLERLAGCSRPALLKRMSPSETRPSRG